MKRPLLILAGIVFVALSSAAIYRSGYVSVKSAGKILANVAYVQTIPMSALQTPHGLPDTIVAGIYLDSAYGTSGGSLFYKFETRYGRYLVYNSVGCTAWTAWPSASDSLPNYGSHGSFYGVPSPPPGGIGYTLFGVKESLVVGESAKVHVNALGSARSVRR